jgi:translin
MNLRKISDKIYTNFAALNKARDHILGEMRKVLKATREAISAIHRNKLSMADTYLQKACSILSKARSEIDKLSLLPVTGLVQNAEGEVAEAALLLAFRKDEPLPGPNEIKISDLGYLHGLGDLVGELRRTTIDALKNDDLELATRAFKQMEDIYTIFLTFDFPSGLTPGVRKKTDVARQLVERTRADISTEVQRRRLIKGMKKLQETLDSK